jgi:hypothetical protein
MDQHPHIQHLNLPIHAPFAAPVLCKDLHEAGLTEQTPFHWKIQNGQAFIWSEAFDPDHYYKQSSSIIDAHYTIAVIPAYSAADLEKIIGEFIHFVKEGNHEITPSKHIRIGTRKAPRYADALALIAIEVLKRRIVQPNIASQLITQ